VDELQKEPAALPSARAQAARQAAEAAGGAGDGTAAVTPLIAFLLDQHAGKGGRGRSVQARTPPLVTTGFQAIGSQGLCAVSALAISSARGAPDCPSSERGRLLVVVPLSPQRRLTRPLHRRCARGASQRTVPRSRPHARRAVLSPPRPGPLRVARRHSARRRSRRRAPRLLPPWPARPRRALRPRAGTTSDPPAAMAGL